MFTIEEEQLSICHECVSDKFLKKGILENGKLGKCSYCENNLKAVKLKWLAENIHSAIEEHFYLTSNEPTPLEYALLRDKESNYDWERQGQPAKYLIQDIAGVAESVADDVQAYLSFYYGGNPKDFEENPYDDEACYEEQTPDRYSFQESWDFFCKEIRYRARFFSQSAEEVLGQLFDDVDSLRTFDGKSVIRSAGPTSENPEIFRTRVSQTQDTLDRILKNPVKELGAPPPKSSKNGRMNSAGISVFYGAADADTCIAEVRPPIGSHVVVGRFQIIRDIRLLDLDILSQVYAKGSYFDSEYGGRKGHAAFLRNLVGELIKPVMPDEETFAYLPTQVVAEYLAEKINPRIDGIIFKSSQVEAEGQNIILFYNSCGVKPYMLPPETTVTINYGWGTDEDYDDSITVYEELTESSQADSSANIYDTELDEDLVNNREITLHLDVNKDIDIRLVTGAKYNSHKRYVSRYRDEKGSGKADTF